MATSPVYGFVISHDKDNHKIKVMYPDGEQIHNLPDGDNDDYRFGDKVRAVYMIQREGQDLSDDAMKGTRAARRPKPTAEEVSACEKRILEMLRTNKEGVSAATLLEREIASDESFNDRIFDEAMKALKDNDRIHKQGAGKGTLWFAGKGK